MKTFTAALVFVIMVFIGGRMVGQNLVGNGSFEIYTSCPDDVGLIDSAVGWSIFGNFQWMGPGTPDYYNACADATQWPDSFASVPHNVAGYQYPATGNGFAGIICYSVTCVDGREIIGCHLNSPLEIGQTYFVSFKANCAFGGYMGNYLGTNGLGAKFSTVSYSNDDPIPINNPTVYSTTVITDTLNWTTLAWSFVADSAYEYLAIGNFIQDANLDTIHLGSFIFRSYYYIDDVCVSANPDCIATGIEMSNTQSPFLLSPNPFTTHLQLHYMLTQPGELMVYDALGRKVKSCTLAASQKTFELSVAELPAGVYLVAVNSGGRVWVKSAVRSEY